MVAGMKGRRIAAGAAGAASAVFGAGVGELSAAIIAPGASPVAAIGSALIDAAPPWAKNTAIALFGTNDKLALIIGIAIALIAVAAGAGLLELWRPPWGRVIMGAFGVVGIIAAMTRADAGMLDWIPSALAGAGAVFALGLLMKRLPATVQARVEVPAMAGADLPSTLPTEPPAGAGAASADKGASSIDRRTFMAWTIGAAAVGVLAAIGGTVLRAGSRAASSVREALHLPTPAVTAAPVPAGADFDMTGLTPIVTPNASFYRIDTALIVPDLDPAKWSLRIHGMVDHEVTLTWDQLLALPLQESYTTLTCVSNTVGGDLIGNALWLGYPIRELLKQAGPHSDADMVLSRSSDGFTAGTPLEALTDDRNAILAVGMNGAPLPVEHGFPVRMVVPGLYGYVSATKWVVDMEVTRFDQASAYWTDRGWSEKGPVKLQSRIDLPKRNQGLGAGDTMIAGVAWQQHVGVSKVEVQVDGGAWQEATLASAISDDTWVQWRIPWTAEKGTHAIRCRATNVNGETQTEVDSFPEPDGATGWQEVTIDVG